MHHPQTAHSIERGFTYYLLLMLHGKIGGAHRLGGPPIAEPKKKKVAKRFNKHIGRPSDPGDYNVVHKGTKEW